MHVFNHLQRGSADAAQTTSISHPSHSHLSVWQINFSFFWFCFLADVISCYLTSIIRFWINLIKQPPLQPSIPYWSHLILCHLLSHHGDGDPHSEAEGEVLSVRDAAFTYRQAVTGGET